MICGKELFNRCERRIDHLMRRCPLWPDSGGSCRRRLLSIEDLCSAIERDKGPRTSGEFLEDVADRLMARMGGVIDEFED